MIHFLLFYKNTYTIFKQFDNASLYEPPIGITIFSPSKIKLGCSTEIILSNSVLTYYFAYLIYKCILILYTYYFYIK